MFFPLFCFFHILKSAIIIEPYAITNYFSNIRNRTSVIFSPILDCFIDAAYLMWQKQRKWPWTEWIVTACWCIGLHMCGEVTGNPREKWLEASDFANRQLIPAQSSADLKLTVCSIHSLGKNKCEHAHGHTHTTSQSMCPFSDMV